MNPRMPRVLVALLIVAVSSVIFAANAAALPPAAHYVYFTDYNGRLMRGPSTGGVAEVVVASAGSEPNGVTIDRRNGRIYWAVRGDNEIRSVASDGSDGQTLNLSPSDIDAPVGVAIDYKRDRILWANSATGGSSGTIGWAALDGSGASGALNVGTASVNAPQGVVVDGPADTIYWANTSGTESAGWAKLDGSGVGDSASSGVGTAVGIALVPSLQQVFWSDYSGNSFGFMSTGGNTATTGAFSGAVTVASSGGIAYDAISDRLIVTDYGAGEMKSYATDGTDGQSLITGAGSPWGAADISGAGVLTASNAPLTISAAPGSTAAGVLKLSNTGDFPLQLLGYSAAPGSFMATTGCPATLAIGASCDLTVTYTPASAGQVSGNVVAHTDGGDFSFAVVGDGGAVILPPLLSNVHAVKRCASPSDAGALSVVYTSAAVTDTTVTLQKSSSQRRAVPKRCPARSDQTGFSSKGIGKKSSASFKTLAGTQAATLKQMFGTKSLKSGRYRMLFNYNDASGNTVRKGTWFWVLAK